MINSTRLALGAVAVFVAGYGTGRWRRGVHRKTVCTCGHRPVDHDGKVGECEWLDDQWNECPCQQYEGASVAATLQRHEQG